MDTDGTDFLQQTIGDREDARFDLLFYYLRFIATAQRLFRGAWICDTLYSVGLSVSWIFGDETITVAKLRDPH